MSDSNVKNVSGEEAYKIINEEKELIILDVRSKEEYDNGHIPGAKLLPVQVLSMRIDELGVYIDKPILVYCASGVRSPRAVETLIENEFTNIYHLSRGISSWTHKLTK
ncbi:rhodanese-like domain-containing protein [Clostridium lacusfryxellense]|uniref:rhodanese-like domain-containing protein n=1 Tax=Clostridium lacusfryxellense TaxID=205328 RepID=UPI001C0CE176|nr:rhodanese-like domain-containing protein [Clostridium lacusfryxellense]MBU3114573.1 rhodanese-like domain-containing protein [Clostridium lacusfryxellense]